MPRVALLVSKPTKLLRLFFCTETSRHVNYSVIVYQTNTGHRVVSLYNESYPMCRTNLHWNVEVAMLSTLCINFQVFAYFICNIRRWSCTFDICLANIFLKSLTDMFCLLPSFLTSTLSFPHGPLSGHFLHLKHFETSALLCVVNGILLHIGRNFWHFLVLQAQISNFHYSLKNLSPVWNYFRWRILCFH